MLLKHCSITETNTLLNKLPSCNSNTNITSLRIKIDNLDRPILSKWSIVFCGHFSFVQRWKLNPSLTSLNLKWSFIENLQFVHNQPERKLAYFNKFLDTCSIRENTHVLSNWYLSYGNWVGSDRYSLLLRHKCLLNEKYYDALF